MILRPHLVLCLALTPLAAAQNNESCAFDPATAMGSSTNWASPRDPIHPAD